MLITWLLKIAQNNLCPIRASCVPSAGFGVASPWTSCSAEVDWLLCCHQSKGKQLQRLQREHNLF